MNGTRLDIRLNPDTKELIQEAAMLSNQTVTQFVVSTLAENASRVVAEHARAALSDRDRDLFLQLLDDAPPPNQALRNAAKSYRRHLAT
jgi:uncharacterized protein (DUF1778 family)